MNNRLSALLASAAAGLLALSGCDSLTDADSGASVSVSGTSTTATTATVSFSERYSNGTLRFYWSSTSFSAADTSKSTVSRTTATSRGNGSVSVADLTPSTTYYYLFQGYYPKGMSTYNATGSFTTTAAAARTASTESQP